MNTIKAIVKKEFSRFFKDKRLVLSLFLPGILIYLIYTFMGSGLFNNFGVDEDYKFKIYAANIRANEMPTEFSAALSSVPNLEVIYIADIEDETAETAENIEEKIQNKVDNYDLLVSFPDNFTQDYDNIKKGNQDNIPIPSIKISYNNTKIESANAYQLFSMLISQFQHEQVEYFHQETNKLSTEKDESGMILSMLVPMLVLIFLVTGCIANVPESIAGEKERGSFATMLATPIKRSHIAIGKIIALSTISLISGTFSFICVILSLPKLMTGSGAEFSFQYTPIDCVMLLSIILSTVLLITALGSILSTMAKSVKEATSFMAPLSILSTVVGVVTMFFQGGSSPILTYLIPLFNSGQCISSILAFTMTPLKFALTICSNLAFTALFIYILAKLFNSEKVIFNS